MSDRQPSADRGARPADDDSYLLNSAEINVEIETARLRNLQQASDPSTISHLDAIGVGPGWRCLEVGAGAGSIAGWLGTRVGPTGSVLATDVNVDRLGNLPSNVEVRQHDIRHEELKPAAYHLVHCRFVLMHLADPAAALKKMTASLAPGGWLVVEEGDFGLVEFAGGAEPARATEVLRTLHAQWAAAGTVNSYFGRRLPGLVLALGLESFGVDVSTQTGRPGDPAYEASRLGWPNIRAGFAATGTAEDDLRCIDIALADSTFVIGITTVGVRGRLSQ
jgi:2-polyprenyl-3-methyl-5-hydroxy-6-metoxy-1,4-benzoquinol methylase